MTNEEIKNTFYSIIDEIINQNCENLIDPETGENTADGEKIDTIVKNFKTLSMVLSQYEEAKKHQFMDYCKNKALPYGTTVGAYTYTQGNARYKADEQLLKAEHPEIYEACLKIDTVKAKTLLKKADPEEISKYFTVEKRNRDGVKVTYE